MDIRKSYIRTAFYIDGFNLFYVSLYEPSAAYPNFEVVIERVIQNKTYFSRKYVSKDEALRKYMHICEHIENYIH